MVLLAINGSHPNLAGVGATFVRDAQTTHYHIFAVEDKYMAAVKADSASTGSSVTLEIWNVPEAGFTGLVMAQPVGLCMGKLSVLKDGTSEYEEVLGVLAEPWYVKDQEDITSYGSWKAFVQALNAGSIMPASKRRKGEEKTAFSFKWLVQSIGKGHGSGPVKATPYNWPYDAKLVKEETVLVIIDMQVDFCGKGGYVDQMGYDLSLTRAPIEPIKRVLAACRKHGVKVIHTREGHRPDLSDLPANKRWRSKQIGAEIGSPGPMGRVLIRGEKGWDIIPELSPIEGEPIIDKPGKGSFYATDLDMLLRGMNARNVVFTGITTDVCVHTTMRDANDMGYECLILADCTGATDFGNHEHALKMVTMQGGVFGAVTFADSFIEALQ